MKLYLVLSLALMTVLAGCEKKATCAQSVELTANTLTPTEGELLEITATRETDYDVYQWSGPGLNEMGNHNKITLDPVKLSESGTYYVSKSNADCNSSLQDSIVIDVQLKQETPPCTLTNNRVDCSNIPDVIFTSVNQGFDATFNAVNITAYGGLGYPSFKILFNSYNGNVEPKDGTYITTDRQTFDILQEPNEISVSFIYASNFYHCHPGQKVYITHVNGKIQASFCNKTFSSPPLPFTTCSGRMTEQ